MEFVALDVGLLVGRFRFDRRRRALLLLRRRLTLPGKGSDGVCFGEKKRTFVNSYYASPCIKQNPALGGALKTSMIVDYLTDLLGFQPFS